MNQVAVIDAEQFFARLEAVLDSKLQALHAQPPQGSSDLPELLSRKQAAQFLGVSLGTVDNLARAGVLQKHFLGSVPKFKKEELLSAFEGWKKYQRA